MTKKELMEKVEAVADESIRPQLMGHGGGMQVADIEEGVVFVKLTGHCSGCPSSKYTVEDLIKGVLTAEIEEVTDVKIHEEVSQELLDFAKKILSEGKR